MRGRPPKYVRQMLRFFSEVSRGITTGLIRFNLKARDYPVGHYSTIELNMAYSGFVPHRSTRFDTREILPSIRVGKRRLSAKVNPLADGQVHDSNSSDKVIHPRKSRTTVKSQHGGKHGKGQIIDPLSEKGRAIAASHDATVIQRIEIKAAQK